MNVVTNYGDNFKRYRVEDVAFDMSPETKFPNKKFSTYLEYFKKSYNVQIHVKNQFLLISTIIVYEKGIKK